MVSRRTAFGEFRWVRSRDLRADDGARPTNADLALPAATVPAPAPPSEPPTTPEEAAEVTDAPEIASTAAPSTRGSDGIAFEKLARGHGVMSTEPIQESHAPEGQSIALAAYGTVGHLRLKPRERGDGAFGLDGCASDPLG